MIPGSWQVVLIITLILCIACGAAAAFWPKKRNRKVHRVWREADYSEQRAKAIEWLGDDYLLAKPINRRG